MKGLSDAELAALAGARICEILLRHEALQIARLHERPDLDLARTDRQDVGAARHPGQRLVHVLDLPDREDGDHLARLGEGPVDDRALVAIHDDALGLGAGLEARARYEN